MAIHFQCNPTKSKRVTRPFGWQKHPIYGTYRGHNGIDIGALVKGKKRDPLYSVADGTIVVAKIDSGDIEKGYGYYCVVQHSGFATLYGHQDSLIVKKGQKVKSGELIGYMGDTGSSTGIHLHFGLTNGDYWAYKWADPLPYLVKEEEEMTEQQIKTLIQEELKKILSGEGIALPVWAEKEGSWKEAQEKKVTDGARPEGYAKRDEVASMVMRAIGQIQK